MPSDARVRHASALLPAVAVIVLSLVASPLTQAQPRDADAVAPDASEHLHRKSLALGRAITADQSTCGDDYVRVERGTFIMGSPESEDGRSDDEVQHSVTITRSFCMKATEVTQGEWQAVMGSNPSLFATCGASCPVERVSWLDAVGYANALSRREGLPECYANELLTGLDCSGYRLPTEAEWEYAARAGSTGSRYGSLDSVAWYDENAERTPHPVAQKQPNAWGLYDMLGNVQEWTGDWFGTYGGEASDPTGAAAGFNRVLRGGSFSYLTLGGSPGVRQAGAPFARAASRTYVGAGSRSPTFGFRLVRTAP